MEQILKFFSGIFGKTETETEFKEETKPETETKTELEKQLETRLREKEVRLNYSYRSKNLSIFSISQILKLQLVEVRKILAKHKLLAILTFILLVSSILFHTLSFQTILDLHFKKGSLLNWFIASGISFSLEMVYTVIKYRKYNKTAFVMFIGLLFALWYSAFSEQLTNGKYLSWKDYLESGNLFRFALGAVSFIGLAGLVSSITPQYLKRRLYKNLSLVEKVTLFLRTKNVSNTHRLVFSDIASAWALKETELRKYLVRKGLYHESFWILPERKPRGKARGKAKKKSKNSN